MTRSTLKTWTLWPVLLGNPIFVRVVEAAGKRLRHAVLRSVYLGALMGVTLVSILFGLAGSSLNELSLVSSRMFAIISFAQLVVAAITAPVFTAGAITQEKDNETFRVLLCTPLSNAQIVYGMLLSRLYLVLALLASGLPIFLITQYFGGVTGGSILLSFAIAASTAVFTGALAISLAVFTSGSGRMVFNFYVCYGLYLIVVGILGASPLYRLSGFGADTSWLTAAHPFLSLSAALRISLPPDEALLGGAGPLTRLWLCRPQIAYVVWTLAVSLVLPAAAAILLRWRQANIRRGGGLRLRLWRRRAHAPRRVWRNCVAWREAATRCSTGGGGLVKWLFFLAGSALALVMLWNYHRGRLGVGEYRGYLASLLCFEFALVLLIVCWFSASAINREIEDGTLELLLMSPITSRDYLGGKLRGLVGLSLVLLILPVATALVQSVYDLANPPGPIPVSLSRGGSRMLDIPLMPLEGVLMIALVLPAFCGLAALVGLGNSLREQRGFKALAKTLGAMVGIVVCLLVFLGITTSLETPVAALAACSSPFTLAMSLTAPHERLRELLVSSETMAGFRLLLLGAAVACAAIYAVIVVLLRRQLENTFDMTVRRRGAS